MLGQSAKRPVVVKIVDPRLKGTIDLDLSFMRAAAGLLELLPRLHWLSLGEAVDEFGQLMEQQVCILTSYRSHQVSATNSDGGAHWIRILTDVHAFPPDAIGIGSWT